MHSYYPGGQFFVSGDDFGNQKLRFQQNYLQTLKSKQHECSLRPTNSSFCSKSSIYNNRAFHKAHCYKTHSWAVSKTLFWFIDPTFVKSNHHTSKARNYEHVCAVHWFDFNLNLNSHSQLVMLPLMQSSKFKQLLNVCSNRFIPTQFFKVSNLLLMAPKNQFLQHCLAELIIETAHGVVALILMGGAVISFKKTLF